MPAILKRSPCPIANKPCKLHGGTVSFAKHMSCNSFQWHGLGLELSVLLHLQWLAWGCTCTCDKDDDCQCGLKMCVAGSWDICTIVNTIAYINVATALVQSQGLLHEAANAQLCKQPQPRLQTHRRQTMCSCLAHYTLRPHMCAYMPLMFAAAAGLAGASHPHC